MGTAICGVLSLSFAWTVPSGTISSSTRRVVCAPLSATEDEDAAGGQTPIPKDTPPTLLELQNGKPPVSTDVAGLIRSRRIERLSGTDVDSFVVDEVKETIIKESSKTKLPDFAEYVASRNGEEEEVYRPKRRLKSDNSEEENSGNIRVDRILLKELRKVTTEPKKGDFFEYGIGGLVKKSVYACIAFAVLWEIYINSPFFERALPPAPIIF